ncbi:MAG: glycosyltransferase family 2 protein [Actinobacteria bacterium]|nr:glycosyltransferase family 2 protein [Actinomycetota bacterium]
MQYAHLAIVMPAYNEAEGIGGFIDEIRDAVAPLAERVTFVIADDRSTDGTAAALAGVDDVLVETQPANRGHGPTALAAYRAGLALSPDALVHVDGDGQFVGSEIAGAVRALARTGADVVHGVRRGRTDAWYRRVLTACVRLLIAVTVGRGVPDVNTPLRVYRPEAVRLLVNAVPSDALVPHVHFSLAEVRARLDVRYLHVRSIPRRGASSTGTMWGKVARPSLPPKKLVLFARDALVEVWRWSLRPGAPLRALSLEGPDPVEAGGPADAGPAVAPGTAGASGAAGTDGVSGAADPANGSGAPDHADARASGAADPANGLGAPGPVEAGGSADGPGAPGPGTPNPAAAPDAPDTRDRGSGSA